MADSRTLDLTVNANTEIARQQLDALANTTGKTAKAVDRDLAAMGGSLQQLVDSQEKLSTRSVLLATTVGSAIGNFVGNIIGQIPSALAQMGQAAVASAGDLKSASEQIGISTDVLQVFRLGADKAGASIDQADGALKRLNSTSGKAASGNKEAAKAFSDIGVSIKDANGNLLPLEALLPKVFDGIAKLPDPARQAAAATKLFGEAGTTILPFLQGGASGFDDLAASAKALGLVLTPETIQHLDEMGNKAKDIRAVITAQLASAIGENAGAILTLGNAAVSAVVGLASFVRQIQALKFLTEQGDFISGWVSNGEELDALGTTKGQLAYSRQKAANATNPTMKKGYQRQADFLQAQLVTEMFPQEQFAAKKPPKPGGKVDDVTTTTKKIKAAKPAKDIWNGESAASLREGGNAEPSLKPTAMSLADLTALVGQAETLKMTTGDIANADIVNPAAADFSLGVMRDISFGLADAILSGQSLGDVFVNAFARAGAALLESGLLNFLSGGREGTSFGSILSGLTGAFGGSKSGGCLSGTVTAEQFASLGATFRADGGRMSAGSAYITGEKGRELLVPLVDMMAIPLGRGGGSVTQNFDLKGAVVTDELFAHIQNVGNQAAQIGALGGRQLAQQDRVRSARRRLGR